MLKSSRVSMQTQCARQRQPILRPSVSVSIRPAAITSQTHVCKALDTEEQRRSEQQQQQQQQQQQPGSPPPPMPWQGGMTWIQFKEQYLRPYYLPVSFTIGTLTFGIKTASENFSFQDDVFNFMGCAIVSGLLVTAFAWCVFDLIDDSGNGDNFSSPQ